jgi:hypothetical protein
VTPIGDIEIEIVFQIAVRGRTGDLARLLKAISNAEAYRYGRAVPKGCNNNGGRFF